MKLRFAAVCTAVVGLLAAAPVCADKLDCKDPQTTYEIDQCAGRDYTAADAALNALYRQLYAKYDAGNKKVFQAAQRSWIKWRDDECSYETNVSVGGTLNSTMFTNCRADLTRERIKRLKAQMNCAEGDLSCNAP